MSNKTQLQTNNTALDALITRVNAAKDVAASLPEAGSGDSGGSGSGGVTVETVTGTFVEDGPCMDYIGTIGFTNENLEYILDLSARYTAGNTINVVKNSMIECSGARGLSTHVNYPSIYVATNDFTIECNM